VDASGSRGLRSEGVGSCVLAGVRAVWAQVLATDFPQRAKALADEIAADQPLLVGLQEVTTYRRGALLDAARAEEVIIDFLDVLLAELAERGTPYRAIVSIDDFDGELPLVGSPQGSFDLRLTDRDVIIVRDDGPASQLQVRGTDAGHFTAALQVGIAGEQVPIVRGWVSADVRHRGKTFRFVNTHREAFDDVVNGAQIAELVAGPLATSLPVVLVGDLNATPGSSMMAPVFAAGFQDTALTAPGGDAGPTCCFDATVTGGTLTSRIDYVLYRGAFEATAQKRVGHLETDQTPTSARRASRRTATASPSCRGGRGTPSRANMRIARR
jgi:hypothetical protein